MASDTHRHRTKTTRKRSTVIPENPWENAHEVQLPESVGILQIVGIESPTHTAFGRVIRRVQQHDESKDETTTVTALDIVQWMLKEIHRHRKNLTSQENDYKNYDMTAEDLLELGAGWILYGPQEGLQKEGVKHSKKAKRKRLFLQDAQSTKPTCQDTIRLHFLPGRFPAADSVSWICGVADQTNTQFSKLPYAIVDYNLEIGYVVVNKPPGLPSHATVDNGVENVLYQLEQANSLLLPTKPSLPQRLDTETSGLMLVATRPAFASYMGRLLQQKSSATATEPNVTMKNSIRKQYRCLVRVQDTKDRNNLLRQMEQHDHIITHYTDPTSTAPKTFVQEPMGSPWLKCMLRILEIGDCRYLKINNEDTTARISSEKNKTTTQQLQQVMEIKVELLTGRTHQIRGQFSALNLPLIGDPLYFGEKATKEVVNDQTLLGDKVNWNQTRNRTITNRDGIESEHATAKLGLQCCYLSLPSLHFTTSDKGKGERLIPKENGKCLEWELTTAWWTDQIYSSC